MDTLLQLAEKTNAPFATMVTLIVLGVLVAITGGGLIRRKMREVERYAEFNRQEQLEKRRMTLLENRSPVNPPPITREQD